MKKSFIFKAMMLIALMCVPFALTSCEEEVVSGPNVYTMDLMELHGELSFLSETETINHAYQKELASLGISIDEQVKMEGNTSDCDNKIIAACKRAEEKLKTYYFEGTYIWSVTRHSVNNKATEIYSYKINYGPDIEAKNPKTVTFAYENFETEDMLEYCNIVIEYSNGKETKSETITEQSWIMTSKNQQLPCTFTFKKYYTLKEDKDMASLNPVNFFLEDSYQYVYHFYNEKEEEISRRGVSSTKKKPTKSKGSTVAEKISTGYFNTVKTFEFSETGKLTVSTKK